MKLHNLSLIAVLAVLSACEKPQVDTAAVAAAESVPSAQSTSSTTPTTSTTTTANTTPVTSATTPVSAPTQLSAPAVNAIAAPAATTTVAAPAATTTTTTAAATTINLSARSSSIAVDAHILVDQFGYRPGDQKVAVIRSPQWGFDIGDTIAPGNNYEVRSATGGATVLTGTITAWNNGGTENSSGDRGWWFDFSKLTTPGQYFVYDVQRNVRSPFFSIDQRVYLPVLKAAVKMYFYQRSGFKKTAQYAGGWADEAAYVYANQDLAARDVTDQGNTSKQRNMSGGWFDAGDTNQYVTFAVAPVHQLLMAYQNNSAVFTDDFDIPESGNGIPDIVDEVKWEIDWLKKMQFDNGGVALKLGVQGHHYTSPPSSDRAPRFYVPVCTSSTIAASGMYAHAAYVYGKIPGLAGEVADLKNRAINAWNNYQSNPNKQTDCDNGAVSAGDADRSVDEQNADAVVAAVYLFSITGDATYGNYVKNNFTKGYMRPYYDYGWSRYNPEQGEALLFYATLPNADAATASKIKADKTNDVNNGSSVYGFTSDDLYRSYLPDAQYHWGSNQPRANYGNTNVDALTYGLAGGKADSVRTRAVEILHYFHGVNPFGKAYLTNMSRYGATSSLTAIFHNWFNAGSLLWGNTKLSTYGPPPGYVPGGPNNTTSVITGQPAQKAYKDWNGDTLTGEPQNSWEVTEPGIYYQSAFVKLVSAFAN